MFLAEFRCAHGHVFEVLLRQRTAEPEGDDRCACGAGPNARVDAVESFMRGQRAYSATCSPNPGATYRNDAGGRVYGGRAESRVPRATALPTRAKPYIGGYIMLPESMQRDRARIAAKRAADEERQR